MERVWSWYAHILHVHITFAQLRIYIIHTQLLQRMKGHYYTNTMHIREVVSKNYSPRGNFIKVWITRGWKPSVFLIVIKLPRVDNFTNDRSPNVHYLFYKMVSQIWAVVSTNARSRHGSITHRINIITIL